MRWILDRLLFQWSLVLQLQFVNEPGVSNEPQIRLLHCQSMLNRDQLLQESAPLLLVYPWAELHGAQRLEAPADDVRDEVLQLLSHDQISLDQPLNLLLSVILRSVLFLALS